VCCGWRVCGDFWNVTKYGSSLILAVCLDGSPPAYHLHRGSGSGANSWLVHLEASHFSYSFIFIYSPSFAFHFNIDPLCYGGFFTNCSFSSQTKYYNHLKQMRHGVMCFEVLFTELLFRVEDGVATYPRVRSAHTLHWVLLCTWVTQ
jgi:hypothetical protein